MRHTHVTDWREALAKAAHIYRSTYTTFAVRVQVKQHEWESKQRQGQRCFALTKIYVPQTGLIP